MKWAAILVIIRACLPAMYVLADAFRFGVNKHGDGTWKDISPVDHVGKAMSKIGEWMVTKNYNLLADAGLRILFALSKCATSAKYNPTSKREPKDKPEVQKDEEIEP